MTFFDVPLIEAPRPETPFNGTGQSDWEDWESESVVTAIEDDEQLICGEPEPEDEEVEIQLDIDLPGISATPFPTPVLPSRPSTKKRLSRKSPHHPTTQKPKRLKSRQRQKAQNAKAGIKLVTDLSVFRKPHGNPGRPTNYKFVDAAALKALEGSPNSASVGNWNWLRRQKSAASSHLTVPTPTNQGLSPADAPIVIGISMEADQAREISPNTAVISSGVQFPDIIARNPPKLSPPTQPLTHAQASSVWSPDTPNTATTIDETSPQSAYSASSIYSMYARRRTGGPFDTIRVPPVPEVPSNFKNTPEKLITVGNEEDLDSGTPYTLFEEDGTTSPRKSLKIAGAPRGLDTVNESSNDAWIATVNLTPAKKPSQPTGDSFRERQARLQKQVPALIDVSPVSPTGAENAWWKDVKEKEEPSGRQRSPSPISIPSARSSPMPRAMPAPAIRTASPSLSPARTPSPFRNPATHRGPSPNRNHTPSPKLPLGSATMTSSNYPVHTPTRVESAADKARILVEESRTPSSTPNPNEEPPPYSPPHQRTQQTPPVRYRPHFPPGHPLRAHFPPSPGPISPAMSRTMTSQGAINMTEIPLTPAPLPERPAGTYLPQEHFTPASGSHNRVERERRRYEKEEVVARKLGGFWKGRGCIPASGCYGRPGREGRKRRRICLIVIASILLLILTIVLAVTLTKKRQKTKQEEKSIFVNITNFPPMPTGVLTVVGPSGLRAFNGCTAPSTLWSCHLPKEQHDEVKPFNSDQPTVVMQIQVDNSTEKLWNVRNGETPRPTPTQPKPEDGANNKSAEPVDSSEESDSENQEDSAGSPDATDRRAARGGSLQSRQQKFGAGISPQPAPPSFEEMFFLGNTTDGIISDDKAGEPTPFYVSLLTSTSQSVGPNLISDSPPSNRLRKRQDSPAALPEPDLNADGTGAPAILLPTQVTQQPIRLYDRGLPSEHYGFYTYFSRRLYLRSITALNNTDRQSDVPLDEEGGSKETESNFLVTWSETRFFVKIFTNSASSKKLLNKGTVGEDSNIDRPGTMPYPVTFGLDTHGGDEKKLVRAWPVDSRQRVDTNKPKSLANVMGNGGSLVNPRKDKNRSFGGFDGGSGGCACEWQNFLETFGG